MAMDNKVYLIGLGSYLCVLQIDWQSLKSLIALFLALDTSFTNSSSSIRKISSSLKENFINDSMNSISQTDFVFVKSYRLVDDGILRHLILQVAHRANTLVE